MTSVTLSGKSDTHADDAAFHYGAKLIFVGGSPRSGTTLVQNILDSHPQIAGGPEFDHIPSVFQLRHLLQEGVHSNRINLFLDDETIDEEIGRLIERLLHPYLERRGRKFLAEKTPFNVFHFEELLQALPETRCIFCVRDPRAVVSSLLQVGKRASGKGQRGPEFTRSLWAAIRFTQKCNFAGFRALAISDRVMLVRYEDLVQQPEQETRRICEFLSVPWAESMLQSGEKEHDGSSTLDGVWYDKNMYQANADPSRMEKWRAELTPFQQALASLAFALDARLVAQGYDFSIAAIPNPARFLAQLVFDVRHWWRWRHQQWAERKQES